MNSILLILPLICGAPGHGPSTLDPERLIPASLPAYVEVLDPSRHLQSLLQNDALGPVREALPESALRLIKLASEANVSRAALGFDHSFLRDKTTFVLLLEGGDRDALRTQVQEAAASAGNPVFAAGPFVGMADSARTVDTVRGVALGKRTPLSENPRFATFRDDVRSGAVRFHINLGKLIPLRPGVSTPQDPTSAFLLSHLMHVAGRARLLSGHVAVDDEVEIHMRAQHPPLPEDRQFCAPAGDGAAVLQGPRDQVMRGSLRRDLTGFFANVGSVLTPDARTEWEALLPRVRELVGQSSDEAPFDELGDAFDLYVTPAKAPASQGISPPRIAVVSQLREGATGQAAEARFRRAMEALTPVMSAAGWSTGQLHSSQHNGVRVLSVPPSEEAAPATEARWATRLHPCLAVVDRRVILASHPSLLEQLIDAALAGHELKREPGDRLFVSGKRLAENAGGYKDLILDWWAGNEGPDRAAAESTLAVVLDFVARVDSMRITAAVSTGSSALTLTLRAPGLTPGK